MDGRKLYKRFEKKYNVFFREFLKVKIHFRMRDVHEMRVALKKLRAQLDYLSELTTGKINNMVDSESIERVFHEAGKLRDHQMNLQILGDRKLSTGATHYFGKHLEAEIQKAKSNLKKELKPNRFRRKKSDDKQLKKLITAYTSKSTQHAAQLYIARQWKQADKIILARTSSKGMHQVRICLKRIESISELLKDEKKFVQPERFDGIMQEIGEWHDLAVFCDSIKAFCAKGNGKRGPEKKELSKLRLALDKKNNAYARDILFSIRQLRKVKNHRKN